MRILQATISVQQYDGTKPSTGRLNIERGDRAVSLDLTREQIKLFQGLVVECQSPKPEIGLQNSTGLPDASIEFYKKLNSLPERTCIPCLAASPYTSKVIEIKIHDLAEFYKNLNSLNDEERQSIEKALYRTNAKPVFDFLSKMEII